MTSGGSRRRECPLPKKLPPFGHEPRDFWALPKSYGYFSGAPPSIPPCGFAVLVIPGKKADAVADRSGVPLLYNLACLYRSLPLPEGKAVRLSRLSYPAPAPCRSGSKGALVAPRGAKSRFKKLVHGVKYRKSVFSFLTGHGLSDILCSSSLSLL